MAQFSDKLHSIAMRQSRIVAGIFIFALSALGGSELQAGLVVPWGDESPSIDANSLSGALDSMVGCETGCGAGSTDSPDGGGANDGLPTKSPRPSMALIETGGGASAPPTGPNASGASNPATPIAASATTETPEISFSRLVESGRLRLPSPPLRGLLDPPKTSL